ncbi:SDR family oxidoreductase [Amnibacterium endophyticum]|uniref:SDR family oxidoreductase n=1 Tax=Amnibacterium endophyticum TaxID=2109337 RepID=A0ABW4LCA7_9MICO
MSQYEKRDPQTMYPAPPFPKQEQSLPGAAWKMDPEPDHGEQSYVGRERLTGYRGIVTGADSGIGRAAAIALSREGADLVLSYLPDEQEDAEAVRDLLEGEGRRAILFPGDISDEQYCKDLVQKGVDELGGLDTLVMVAGRMKSNDDILTLDTDAIDSTFKTNIYSLFWLTKAAVPHLEPGSTIVTTGSTQASTPSPDKVDYAVSKGAIKIFTQAIAQQLASKGIRVNSVAPGPVWTPLQPGSDDAETVSSFGEGSPLGRPGQPAELAAAYVHLVSPESSYQTGSTVAIAGGMPVF